MQIATIKLHQGEASFSSINEMREEHLRLLERQGEEPESVPQKTTGSMSQIDTFLRRGIGLGRSLDAPDLRAEAQNMLDYWVSTLSIHQRGLKDEETRSFTAAILERFDSSALEGAINSASKLMKSASADEELAVKRMLMRLAPMAEQGDHFKLITLKTRDLTGGDVDQLALLERFEATGVVQKFRNEGDDEDSWRLTHQSVIVRWPEFAEWTATRRRFRQTATLWDESTRSKQSLPRSSESLAEPLAYRDLNSLESDFLEAASVETRKIEKLESRYKTIALTVALAVLSLMGIAGFMWMKAEERKDEVLQVQGEKAEAEKDNKLLKGEKEHLEFVANSNDLSPVVKDLRQENTALREEVEKLTSELREIQKQLSFENFEKAQKSLKELSDSTATTPMGSTEVSEKLKKIEGYLNVSRVAETHQKLRSFQRTASSNIDPKSVIVPNHSVAKALDLKMNQPLSPGVRVTGKSGKIRTHGSAGFFMTDSQGQKFLASPAYVVGSQAGGPVHAEGRKIGVVDRVLADRAGAPTSISLVRLRPEIKVRNLLPSVGLINGWLDSPQPGQEVVLIGQSTGRQVGKIMKIDENGNIVTSRISKSGDGGAPVVTLKDNRLVGLLILSNEEQSVISPCSSIFKESGMTLLKSSRPSHALQGAMVQLIVPDSKKEYQEFGVRLIQKLQRNGVFIPDGEPLLRANTPEQTDIRYYYDTDKERARLLEQKLQQVGFSSGLNVYDNRRWTPVDEAFPPEKFIQIAFNKEQLDEAIRAGN